MLMKGTMEFERSAKRWKRKSRCQLHRYGWMVGVEIRREEGDTSNPGRKNLVKEARKEQSLLAGTRRIISM